MPPGHTYGWNPYVWLVYLGFFLLYPILRGDSLSQWLVTVVGVILFLGLYFRAFWTGGDELLLIIGGMTVMGLIYAPLNAGASAFFIYAAAFACDVGSSRRAFLVIVTIVAVVLVETWVLDLPPWFWIPATVFSFVVGGTNIHWADRRRAGERLRKVQGEMAAIAERDRIARDLHDLLGHNLSMIILKTELASKLFDRDRDRARAEIEQVESISRETLGRVREAVAGFRSQGLPNEVEFVRSNLESAGITTSVTMDAPLLSPAIENVAALFLREACTNIIRHSRAKHAWIEIEQDDGTCRLAIRDDGRGKIEREGFGIGGMRARIEAVGGSLDLENCDGTVLRATVPADGRNDDSRGHR